MYSGSESNPRMKTIVIVYAGTMDLSETGGDDKAEVKIEAALRSLLQDES